MNFVKLTVLPDASNCIPLPPGARSYINLERVVRIVSDASGSILWLTPNGDVMVRVSETAEQIFELASKPIFETPRKSASILGS